MTYRERLKREHPEMVNESYIGGCKGCPKDYGYEDEYNLPDCSLENCKECWDREIPESEVLDCSEAPNSSDLISRQVAIDAVEKNACNTQRIMDAINNLPSAQPEIVRCGVCSRRRMMCDGRRRCTVFNVIVDPASYCKWGRKWGRKENR